MPPQVAVSGERKLNFPTNSKNYQILQTCRKRQREQLSYLCRSPIWSGRRRKLPRLAGNLVFRTNSKNYQNLQVVGAQWGEQLSYMGWSSIRPGSTWNWPRTIGNPRNGCSWFNAKTNFNATTNAWAFLLGLRRSLLVVGIDGNRCRNQRKRVKPIGQTGTLWLWFVKLG